MCIAYAWASLVATGIPSGMMFDVSQTFSVIFVMLCIKSLIADVGYCL